MAVKPRGSTSGKKASSTELAITLPAGTASGDFAVLIAQTSANAATWTTPAGWTLLAESELKTEAGGSRSVAIFTRKLTGATGENLPTIKASASGTLGYSVEVTEVGTYDATNPIDVHSAWLESPSTDPLEHTFNDGSTTVAGDLGLLILSETQQPSVAPTGWTVQTSGSASTYTYTKAELGSGTTVSAAVTKNTKVVYWAFLLAIKATAGSETKTVSATVSGAGAATAPTLKAATVAANVTGAGRSTASVQRAAVLTASVTGAGAAKATTTKVATVTALVHGAGEAHATTSLVVTVIAAVHGAGAAKATTLKAALVTGAVHGAGRVTASATRAASVVARASAGGNVSARTLKAASVVATVRGGGAAHAVLVVQGAKVALVRGGGDAHAVILAIVLQAPTGTPTAGHVAVGQAGRLARDTGKATTTNSGRARR